MESAGAAPSSLVSSRGGQERCRRLERFLASHPSASFEELYGTFMLLCGRAGFERAEVPSPSALPIDLSRVQAILTGLQFADHREPPAGWSK